MDWQAWLDRWDAQQTTYVPEREERFGVIADVVRAVAGEQPRVLDLGCGPGSLSVRLRESLPGAEVLAVDADPVLMELGRQALGERGPRWLDADFRDPSWVAGAPGAWDAAVSTTALHWLPAERLPAFYAEVAGRLRPGGVFVDGDHLGFGPAEPGLADLAERLRAGWDERRPAPAAEDWDGWWRALEREPELAGAFAERLRRRHGHPPTVVESSRLDDHAGALRAAGFAEVGTVWQRGDDRVLVALR
jgi:SAM-dependent methyltransferase